MLEHYLAPAVNKMPKTVHAGDGVPSLRRPLTAQADTRPPATMLQTSLGDVLVRAGRNSNCLQLEGVQIADDKKENSAAVLIGFALLTNAVVALRASSRSPAGPSH
jgi:hypothetical protein